MKFYSISIDENLKNNDLLIDSRIKDNNNSMFKTPIILVSLVRKFFNLHRNLYQILIKALNGYADSLD
jgi:hypothetical protein